MTLELDMIAQESARTGAPRAQPTGVRAAWHVVTRPRNRDGYLMLLPALVTIAVFVIWPVINSLYLSFHDWHLLRADHAFVGLDNYRTVVADPDFWNALKNTATYSAGTVPTRMALALLLALVFNGGMPFSKILRAIVYLPHVASMVVISFVWLFLLDRDLGVISNTLLPALGMAPIAFMRDPNLALPSIMAMAVWKSLGYEVMVFLAGLQGIHREYLEAAAIDGANRWQVFWHVTLPLLSPVVMFLAIIGVIFSFQVFESIYVMTEGGPLKRTEVLVYYVYFHGFEAYRLGYASALAYIIFMIIISLTILQFWMAGYFRKEA